MPINPQVILQNECPAQVACLCAGQVIVNDQLEIPPQKPDIEQIINYSVNAEITEWKVINTPLGPKVIASGTVRIGVQYVADVPAQSVHFAHFDIPWHTFFLCESNVTPFPGICNLTVCIEFADFEQIDPRHIEKTIVLFLCAQACPPPCPPCPPTSTATGTTNGTGNGTAPNVP